MKKVTFTILAHILIITSALGQNIDSLEKKQDSIQYLCAQGDLYTNMADSLIQYSQPKTRVISIAEASKAGDYVLKAIQINKMFNDTIAARNNFDRLGQAYIMQNKFAEAKWYFLQSNYISRNRRDVPRIISGLLQLADVKILIKDYALAEKDLREAIVLSKYSFNVPAQILVERKLAALYDRTGKLQDAQVTVAHYTQLAANLKKEKSRQLLAIQKAKAKKTSRTTAVLGAIPTPAVTDIAASVSEQNN